MEDSFMQSQQIECFLVLAETLNFSQTAKRLYLSQPAVSKKIKALELELDVILFQRNKRTVILTPAGHAFYEDAQDIMLRLHLAEKRLKNYRNKFESTLVIGYEENTFEKEFIPKLFQLFLKKYPNRHIYLKTIVDSERNQSLLTRKFDIVFTAEDKVDFSKEIYFQSLVNDSLVVVTPKDHPLTKLSNVTLSDLNKYSLILLNPRYSPAKMRNLQYELQNFCPDSIISFSDSSINSHILIESGFGIAVMPKFVAPKESAFSLLPIQTTISFSYGMATLFPIERKEIAEIFKYSKQI